MAAAAVCLLAGCATHRPPLLGPVFFPPPPEPPRLQFLKSYSDSDDLGGQSRFTRFILGKIPPKPIAKPYGVTVHGSCLYVCDTALRTVSILDLQTKRMSFFAPEGDARFHTPINIAIDQDGTRYVADAGRGQVLIFGPDEQYAGAIGVRSTPRPTATPAEPAATNSIAEKEARSAADSALEIKPTDVIVSASRLYVTDLKGHCVRVYDKRTRNPLFTIPREASTGDVARIFLPTNLAQDREGRIYVGDTGGFRVQLYDPDGVFIRSFGRYGDRFGELARPKGVAVDREGRVYVVDAKFEAAQIFDPAGNLLLVFGEPGAGPVSLSLPACIAIDYDNVGLFQQYAAPGFRLEYLVIITNQYGDRKVSVYGFGHPQ